MKQAYTAPEMEISVFDVEDVITLSNGGALTDGEDYGNLFTE